MCDTTRWYCRTHPTHSHLWHDSFISAMRLLHTFDTTRWYCWTHSTALQSPRWPTSACDMTHSHLSCDSFTSVTWHVHTCDMTHPHVRHDSCIHVTQLIHINIWQGSFSSITWHIHICDTTHSYLWHDSFILPSPSHQNSTSTTLTNIGWQKSIECPILIGHFPQKSPIISG